MTETIKAKVEKAVEEIKKMGIKEIQLSDLVRVLVRVTGKTEQYVRICLRDLELKGKLKVVGDSKHGSKKVIFE